MTDALEKRCRTLQEQLRLAQLENDAITSQAEDYLLLGRVVEGILDKLKIGRPMPAAGLCDILRKRATCLC